MPTRILLAIVLAGSLASIALAAPAGNGSGAEHHDASAHEQPIAPDQVIASLDQTLAWYRDARLAMRGVGSLFGREDEQTALAVLRSAFETARAQAALLAGSAPAAAASQPGEAGSLAGKSTEIKTAIEADQQEVKRLQQHLRNAARAQRAAVQDDLVAASNRLELDKVRLDFLTKLESSEVSAASTDVDLAHQIQTLEDAVPELRLTDQAAPAAATPAPGAGGNWGLVQRLIGIYHTQRSLDRLDLRTAALDRRIGKDLRAAQTSLHPVLGQLRALTADPSPNGSLAEGQKAFRTLLQQSKQLTAVVVSLRGESALVRRFAGDLAGWNSSLDRERWQIVQSLGLGLIGVTIVLAAILVGGMVWRMATVRYVHDTYRRRLLLMARNVVVVTTMAFVLIFHFASELTALVTGLGFAAAGIAFALQNVILALAGYFSMVAPNGIRVGDRVSLQGPFGYVQGEVLEIGLVRIRLRELTGDPLRPTGRIVIFPNSVAFTGSFFKLPSPAEEREEGPRRAAA